MKNFTKYENNPVFGDEETGTVFDACVTRDGGRYRMDFSWRPEKACAVTFSDDGVRWEKPRITLGPDASTGWEDGINRNCVLKIGGIYKMWYTGQARGYSFIGYAESGDGVRFGRKFAEPVLIPEYPWERESVMNPCVLYENGEYRMWYSAGETYEPNALGYAVSPDGVNWKKIKFNPIFVCDPENYYEKERIGGCQVLKPEDGYYLFYIGYEDVDTARICVARSEDGVTGWKKSPLNPIISPDRGGWDGDACYKPTVIWDGGRGNWTLWYNGRNGSREYIGYAEYDKRDLF